jgi:phage baseplate assembly protein W
MQPEFGTDLQYYLFEPIVDELTFKETIVGEIRSALSMWMPYVAIQDVHMNINPIDDGRVASTQVNNAIVITIDIYITGTNIYLPVQIFISETGGLTII